MRPSRGVAHRGTPSRRPSVHALPSGPDVQTAGTGAGPVGATATYSRPSSQAPKPAAFPVVGGEVLAEHDHRQPPTTDSGIERRPGPLSRKAEPLPSFGHCGVGQCPNPPKGPKFPADVSRG